MGKNIELEGKVLKISIFSMLCFSVLGIIFGLILSSNFIIFDGLYSLLGVVLSSVTYKVSRFIGKKDHFNFPFGKESIEPGIIVFQYIIILLVLIATLVESITTIINGGVPLVLGWTIAYIAISTLLLFWVYIILKKKGNGSYSGLVDAEILQWRLSCIQSLGALIAYLIAQVIVMMSFDNLLPYIDPVILAIVALALLKTPIVEIWKALKELLGMRTVSDELEKDLQSRLDEICKEYEIKKSYLRIRKTGGIVFVEIDFLVDNDFKYSKIEQQDMIREKVDESLNLIHYDVWLTIAFTSHKKWAE